MEVLSPSVQDQSAFDTSSAFAICNLLLLMPHLKVKSEMEIDYGTATPALLLQVADAADATLLIVHIGTSAIGRLLTQAATEPLFEKSVADSIEALGWLIAELNDFACAAHKISASCRRHTSEHAPETLTTISLARP
ncbi:hypothetical protein HSX11_02495 [Oxalobacteraceae bacterium]|nr:hypothetical protein [Oxalobacteraceae bacterium]